MPRPTKQGPAPHAADDDDAVGPGVVATSAPLAQLAQEWHELHARVPGASPFLHPSWHETWLRHHGANCEPLFLAFRQGEELVGVIALDGGGAELEELGDPEVRDYGGPLVLPGHEVAVADTLIEWLMEDFSNALVLRGIRADAPIRPALGAAAAAHGWDVKETQVAVSPGLALPPTWDEYLAALGKHDRHELRRKLRNLEAVGAVKYESVTEPPRLASYFAAFAGQLRASREDKAAFLTAEREAFFRDLATTFSALGQMRLGVLSLDHKPVATLFTFEDEATLYLYNSGYNPDYHHLAVGLLSKAMAIRDAIAQGKRRYDFLRGDEEYKRHLGGTPIAVFDVRLHR